MERVANVPFHIAGMDAVHASDAPDSFRAERRLRERALLAAYGACLLAWFVAFLASYAGVAAGAPGDFLWSLMELIRIGGLGIGAMAALSAVWMHVAYVAFRKRSAAG